MSVKQEAPAEIEERDGKPVAMKFKFGPGVEISAAITAWDPPRMFTGQGEVYGGSASRLLARSRIPVARAWWR